MDLLYWKIHKLKMPHLQQYLGMRCSCISGISVFKWKTNVRLKGLYYSCWLKNLTYVGKDPIQKDYKDVFSYCDLSLFEWEVGWSCLTLLLALDPRPQCRGHSEKLTIMSSCFHQAFLGHGTAYSYLWLVAATNSQKNWDVQESHFPSLAFKDWLAKENTFVIWKNVVLLCK